MNTGSVSRDQWQLFTREFSSSQVDHAGESDVQRPPWVTQQVGEVTRAN